MSDLAHGDDIEPEAQRSGVSLFRKALFSVMVLAGLASTVSAGTYASFNASTTSARSEFSTGSLVLGRELNSSGSFCLSTGGGTNTDTNANTGCAAMVNLTTVKLGDAAATADLTIKNDGTLPGTLYYRSSGCTSATNGSYYNGGANLCTKTNLVIQEYTDGGRLTAKSSCVYPAQPSSSCPVITAATSPTHLPNSMPTTDTTQGVMASAALRYYRVFLQLPNTGLGVADETQGQRASFALTWTLSG